MCPCSDLKCWSSVYRSSQLGSSVVSIVDNVGELVAVVVVVFGSLLGVGGVLVEEDGSIRLLLLFLFVDMRDME